MPWKKSTRSGANGCVEVNVALPDVGVGNSVGVRDSKDPHSPVISFARESWSDFLSQVRAGRYDRPAV
jgi:hypothetical protein